HTGHTVVRGAGDPQLLRREDITLPEVLWQGGYTTAGIGEWGLGTIGTTGAPLRKGFDYWYGFLTDEEAAHPYPPFVWRNEEQVPIPENANGGEKRYANDILTQGVLD